MHRSLPGEVNGHIVGRILKETVRRAAVIIRKEVAVFESQGKIGYDGGMDDVFTSADTKAQEIYLRTFVECFPNFGYVCEEKGLCHLPGDGNLYFTVDPLDGTKAYIRRQSHGVASMVALVKNDEVISAYIADVNTDEVYGYRPDSSHVFRITRLDSFEELTYGGTLGSLVDLSKAFAILRDPLENYSPQSRALIDHNFTGGRYEIMGSSIGTWLARLWKREVAAALIPVGFETPWDSTPIIGISKKLGYLFLRPDKKHGWEEFDPVLCTTPYRREHDVLIVHKYDWARMGYV
jgi:hypothetical protein